MEHEELTEIIIGCAYKVYNKLGFGFLEGIYQKALAIELQGLGLDVKMEIGIEVTYDGLIIGEFIADMLINGIVLVELKSVRVLSKAHEAQLVNYLAATKMPVGLLINFGESEVQIRRRTPNWRPVK